MFTINIVAQTLSRGPLSVSDDIGRAVQVHRLNIFKYQHEESYFMVEEIVESKNLLQDCEEAHCRALAVLFRNNK